MIYVNIHESSSSESSSESGCKHVDIEDYEFKESLFSYIVEKFDEKVVCGSDITNEIRLYNAEMGIETDEEIIYDVMIELGLVKEVAI